MLIAFILAFLANNWLTLTYFVPLPLIYLRSAGILAHHFSREFAFSAPASPDAGNWVFAFFCSAYVAGSWPVTMPCYLLFKYRAIVFQIPGLRNAVGGLLGPGTPYVTRSEKREKENEVLRRNAQEREYYITRLERECGIS